MIREGRGGQFRATADVCGIQPAGAMRAGIWGRFMPFFGHFVPWDLSRCKALKKIGQSVASVCGEPERRSAA